ncbi:AbrB/MazE/SpoVT family DNA-binding domain-containing protein [Paraburkholderia caballeronis]|uniref:Looped-hinge helix DNA binding domain-containing protein, AbrB family n=1 Tax=Paraburkholderia caballeronis TaxID=416943 RepID=A0A1H7L594_9BURK|nr:AbrB/MazE/SpoVT family DNA-binding domain-containing protein [Paraburkholderia caballeronis]PXW28278.1 AbrB family looped-hinge helix DNA binding protein [Paraburkholderia caballeronis]PXX03644.1 AbrB family looped-hinge helix DNA binding protein [Paraburkholderia caballeronis]RAK04388.1 AbrB family looped-hinge helix DNA binding protein [Paraburkholderia caballeronis]SED82278.1 looped-hinge helix DNA binding domain-containing protein, AbrB family [Paraburkholderia caballeronis]SEK93595.1 l
MASSLLDKRGRTTVPARIRSVLDLRPGARLRWHVTPDGVILVRPKKTKSVRELAGLLQPNSPDTAIDVDEMNPWRDG